MCAIFYGITRPMEVVLAQRRQLMLPSEAGMERDEVLIHHVRPKTRRRAAKKQYSTVRDTAAIRLTSKSLPTSRPTTTSGRAALMSSRSGWTMLFGGSRCQRAFSELEDCAAAERAQRFGKNGTLPTCAGECG